MEGSPGYIKVMLYALSTWGSPALGTTGSLFSFLSNMEATVFLIYYLLSIGTWGWFLRALIPSTSSPLLSQNREFLK